MSEREQVWLLDAEGNGCRYRGVSLTEESADAAVRALLAAEGVTEVNVQRARVIDGWQPVADGYERTGQPWRALAGGRIEWLPAVA